ncbi:phosphonate ABC transporter, permease protein PhnE [Elioraea sp.]|uniref:phosphonate ABC transporter, permease protein PhnE n=1 Tax=Elioraea sp. TaxID=2185103 RepID=UPI0025BB30C4|nr:phosphonate ABC transporter, permease protein PhnE [Elioraea sp.]
MNTATPALADAGFAPLLRERARRDAVRAATAIAGLAGAVLLTADVAGFEPGRLVAGLPRLGEFLVLMVPELALRSIVEDVGHWYWNIGHWLMLLLDTVLMAGLATALGTIGGALLSFSASRNLTRGPVVYWIVRRVLEFARAVPDLVFAIIFVFSFGLGPLAGVLAIAVHTLGAQGKLFAEANENVDMGPLFGVRACGGDRREEILWAVVPQVLPNWVSFTFWRFEINLRSATIIGFVGAGGIGVELYDALRLNYYDDTGAILLLVALCVFVIDDASERLRLRIAGGARQ